VIFRSRRLTAFVLACLTGCLVSGCSQNKPKEDDSVHVEPSPHFAQGTTMEKLAKRGSLRVAVKFDQPGFGYMKPDGDIPEGFDVEMAKMLAGGMGIAPDHITWIQAHSDDREDLLASGKVDLVVATYSITPQREKLVGMAGPYFETQQQLMVRHTNGTTEDTVNLRGKPVCAVRNTTAERTIASSLHAVAAPQSTYEGCVKSLEDGDVEAVVGDASTLTAYAVKKPSTLEVLNDTLSRESYGIGYRKDDSAMCEYINTMLNRSFINGTWTKAQSKYFWKNLHAVSQLPDLRPCGKDDA
jgi:glutamate transport system substrate-binding protein